MAEQVDVYKLIVEVEGAQTIGQLETGLKTLRDELKNQKIGSKEFTELSTAIKDTELQLDSAGKTASKAGTGISAAFGNAAQGITSGFQSAFGAMAIFTNGSEQSIEAMARLQGLMQLKEGVKGIRDSIVQMSGLEKMVAKGIKGFNGLKVAIAGTGVGLLVLAFTSLIAAMSRFDSVMDLVNDGLAILKGAVNAVIETLALLGRAIVKVFQGDFKGAAEDAKNAVTGFNERLKESVNVSLEVERATRKLEDAQVDFILTQAKLRKNIEESKEIMSDSNKTLLERKKALDLARRSSEQLYAKEIELAKEALRIAREELSVKNELNKNDKERLANLEKDIFDLESAKAKEGRILNKTEKGILDEQNRLAEEAREKRRKRIEDDIKLERERLEILGQLTIEKEKEFLDRRLKAGLIGKKEYNNAVLKLDVEYQKMLDKQNAELIDSQAAVSKMLLQLTKEQLDEELKLNSDYVKQRQLELMNQLLGGDISDKEFKDAMLAEQQNALQAEIDLRMMYGEDVTDLLIKQAQIEIDLNKQKNDQIIKDDQDLYDAKILIAQSSADIIENLGAALLQNQDEQNAAAKVAALVRIGIDTAQAISALVKNSEQNPANAVTGGIAGAAQFISGIARITKNIAEARKLLGGGGGVNTNVSQPTFNTPSVNNEPQTVRTITGQQTIKSVVLVKDINSAQNKLNVIDGNSFIIE